MGCAGYTGCPVLAEFLGLTRRRRLRRRDVSNNTAGKRLQGLVLGLLTCPVAHGVVQILVRSAPHGHLVSAFGPTFDAAWKRKRTTLLEHLAIRCSVAAPRLTAHASLQQLLSARVGVGDDVALQRTKPPRLRTPAVNITAGVSDYLGLRVAGVLCHTAQCGTGSPIQ